jgi:hypothetical protein
MAQPGDPGKTVSLALARKSREKLYDSLITKIEQHRVAEVTTQLEYRGLVSRPGKKLEADGVAVHPDFWLYEPLTSRVLVCDYKHALPPFGPAGVANRLKDLESWRRQVRKYIQFVANHSAYVADALAVPVVSDCTGLILLRWPMPIPSNFASDVILADWPTLKALLDQGVNIGIDELRQFFQHLRLASKEFSGSVKITSQDIVVCDWTYKHPVVALEPRETDSNGQR